MAKLIYYKDKKGEWRWRFVASNGRTVAESGEGYTTITGAKKGFKSFRDSATIALCKVHGDD